MFNKNKSYSQNMPLNLIQSSLIDIFYDNSIKNFLKPVWNLNKIWHETFVGIFSKCDIVIWCWLLFFYYFFVINYNKCSTQPHYLFAIHRWLSRSLVSKIIITQNIWASNCFLNFKMPPQPACPMMPIIAKMDSSCTLNSKVNAKFSIWSIQFDVL